VLGWASLPFVPTEPVLVGAGSFAATGTLHLPLVVAAAAVGSLGSDLAKYALGRAAGPALLRRLSRSAAGARAVEWIERRARRGRAVVLRAVRRGRRDPALRGAAHAAVAGRRGVDRGRRTVVGHVRAAGVRRGRRYARPLRGALLALPVALVLGMVASRLTTARTAD
jgi:hypothetical protein